METLKLKEFLKSPTSLLNQLDNDVLEKKESQLLWLRQVLSDDDLLLCATFNKMFEKGIPITPDFYKENIENGISVVQKLSTLEKNDKTATSILYFIRHYPNSLISSEARLRPGMQSHLANVISNFDNKKVENMFLQPQVFGFSINDGFCNWIDIKIPIILEAILKRIMLQRHGQDGFNMNCTECELTEGGGMTDKMFVVMESMKETHQSCYVQFLKFKAWIHDFDKEKIKWCCYNSRKSKDIWPDVNQKLFDNSFSFALKHMKITIWLTFVFKFIDVFSEYYLMTSYWYQFYCYPNETFIEYRNVLEENNSKNLSTITDNALIWYMSKLHPMTPALIISIITLSTILVQFLTLEGNSNFHHLMRYFLGCPCKAQIKEKTTIQKIWNLDYDFQGIWEHMKPYFIKPVLIIYEPLFTACYYNHFMTSVAFLRKNIYFNKGNKIIQTMRVDCKCNEKFKSRKLINQEASDTSEELIKQDLKVWKEEDLTDLEELVLRVYSSSRKHSTAYEDTPMVIFKSSIIFPLLLTNVNWQKISIHSIILFVSTASSFCSIGSALTETHFSHPNKTKLDKRRRNKIPYRISMVLLSTGRVISYLSFSYALMMFIWKNFSEISNDYLAYICNGILLFSLILPYGASLISALVLRMLFKSVFYREQFWYAILSPLNFLKDFIEDTKEEKTLDHKSEIEVEMDEMKGEVKLDLEDSDNHNNSRKVVKLSLSSIPPIFHGVCSLWNILFSVLSIYMASKILDIPFWTQVGSLYENINYVLGNYSIPLVALSLEFVGTWVLLLYYYGIHRWIGLKEGSYQKIRIGFWLLSVILFGTPLLIYIFDEVVPILMVLFMIIIFVILFCIAVSSITYYQLQDDLLL